MEIVSEGSLESISRPASTSKRCSSRSSVKSTSSSVQHSLDVLPPEEPSFTWSTNFEVEEDLVVTDITEDLNPDEAATDDVSFQTKDENLITNTDNSLFPINGAALQAKSEQEAVNIVNKDDSLSTDGTALQVIEPAKTSAAENTSNQSDLGNKGDNNDQSAESETSSTAGSLENDDLDPKIRKGMDRIRKLDNILIEKVKKEREVKKQRRDQERMWREQLEMLERSRDAELGKPVDLGPAHMLALGAPNDAEEDVRDDSPPITPLFSTQPLVDEERLQRQKRQEDEIHVTEGQSVNTKGDETSKNESNDTTNHGEGMEENVKKNNKKNKKDRKTKKKDFIKRNILLAADANNVVAMTEDEKKRLEEILSDMGDLMDESKDQESLIVYGDGFVPSQEEVKQLADIEKQLQSLVPSEEYAALCENSAEERDSQHLQAETPRSENGSILTDEEIPTFGELVLQEKKEMREMKQRLMVIEEQLQRFQNQDDDEGVLSESLLRQLLDDNSRTTSQATSILDRLSSTSMSCDTTSSFDRSSVILESSISSTSTLEQ